METTTRVVGLDLSLTGTGIATTDGTTLTVRTNDRDGDHRLVTIGDVVAGAVDHADLVVIEDLPVHGHGAGKTGMVQGVVRALLMRRGITYVTITAAGLKMFATGKGTATKPDMRMELFKRTGLDVKDDNQVDAWFLREVGLHLSGHPTITLPQTHLRALEASKIKWVRS